MREIFLGPAFMGYLIMVGAFGAFLSTFVQSWWYAPDRAFWLTRLTYESKEDQKFARAFWLLAWLLAVIGSFVLAYNDPRLSHTSVWISAQTCMNIVSIWLLAKAVMAIAILVSWIKNWICGK